MPTALHQHQPLYAQLLQRLNRPQGLNLAAKKLPDSHSACKQVLSQLQAWQVPIAQQGQHYHLTQACTGLAALDIYQHLSPHSQQQLQNLHVFADIDSSNAFLLRQAQPHASVCVADHQSQGRGQHGKTWQSDFAKGLYLSFAYHYPKPPPSGLAPAIAVILVNTLASQGYKGIEIKWPNDLLYQGRKLAGILVEMRHNQQGSTVVVGVGLNWQLPTAISDFDYGVSALEQIRPQTENNNTLCAQLIDALFQGLQTFPEQGLSPYLDDWQQYDALKDKNVSISNAPDDFSGIAVGIDAQGALQIQTPQGLRQIQQGSVRL